MPGATNSLTVSNTGTLSSGFGGIYVPDGTVTLSGKEVQLTPTEYDLLRLLLTHAGKVMTHSQLLKQIWGIAYLEQPHVLRVNISNLRRKIEADPSRPRHIITEPGVGYRLRVSE